MSSVLLSWNDPFPSPRFMTANYSVVKTVITKVAVSMSPWIPHCMVLLLEPRTHMFLCYVSWCALAKLKTVKDDATANS